MSNPGALLHLPLRGLRVALLEARRSSELADLVRRYGGEPHSVPALRETPRDSPEECEAVARAIEGLSDVRAPLAIFTTGVGVDALFRVAEKVDRRRELEAIVARATNVCRGPKPVAALKRLKMPVGVRAESPHTTQELLDALEPLRAEAALLVHHGERSEPLVDAVRARCDALFELLLYAWEMPEDTAPLRNLVAEIVCGRHIDAVVFTTQVQARHLFAIAEELGMRDALVEAMNHRTIVVAVGPTCAAVLASLGTPARVAPESPKMGPMVLALARYLDGAVSQG